MVKRKKIYGYAGQYEVDSNGSVFSMFSPWGQPQNKQLKGIKNTRGYLQVALYHPQTRKPKMFLVSRLVLAAFEGPCPNGWTASHLDNDRLNNTFSNLRWETMQDNNRRKKLHGTDRAKRDRLTETERNFIHHFYHNLGYTQAAIAQTLGRTLTTVNRYCR